MYESLERHVIALPPDELSRTNLEDIALCAAWYDSYSDDQEKLAPYADLRVRLDLWVNSVVAREKTAGHRQQPLLRTVTSDLSRDRLKDLQRDEVNLST